MIIIKTHLVKLFSLFSSQQRAAAIIYARTVTTVTDSRLKAYRMR